MGVGPALFSKARFSAASRPGFSQRFACQPNARDSIRVAALCLEPRTVHYKSSLPQVKMPAPPLERLSKVLAKTLCVSPRSLRLILTAESAEEAENASRGVAASARNRLPITARTSDNCSNKCGTAAPGYASCSFVFFVDSFSAPRTPFKTKSPTSSPTPALCCIVDFNQRLDPYSPSTRGHFLW